MKGSGLVLNMLARYPCDEVITCVRAGLQKRTLTRVYPGYLQSHRCVDRKELSGYKNGCCETVSPEALITSRTICWGNWGNWIFDIIELRNLKRCED